MLRIMPIGILLALSACGTPQPVRDLADKTGATTSVLSSQMVRRAQDNADLATLRATNAARLHSVAVEEEAKLNVLKEALTQSGESNVVTLYNTLDTFSKKVATDYEAAENAESTRQQLILSTQKPLTTSASDMAAVAKDLSALAKADDPESRLGFLVGYIQDVGTQVAEREKAAKEAQQKAESDLKKVAPKPTEGAGDSK